MTKISLALLTLLIAHGTAGTTAQAARETFSAIARDGDGTDPRGFVPITVTIDRYTTDAEHARLRTIAKQGAAAVQADLDATADLGTIVVGGRRTALKYAYKPPQNGGRTITLLTAGPVAVFDRTAQHAPPADHSIAFVRLDFSTPGFAIGALHPAVGVTVTADGLIAIQDDRAVAVRLSDVKRE